MMGRQEADHGQLLYLFNLERRVPADHLLRRINPAVAQIMLGVREKLAPFYSDIGRPSIDPELLIRMLIVGYCYGIRSERHLCQEVELHLAYRWFCRLGVEDPVPDHSTFSVNRHGRFRASDTLRQVQFGYGLNYLIDIENAVIVDVEATPARTYDEVAATKMMLKRTEERFGLKPSRLSADTAYGTGRFLDWLINAGIAPHIPVWDMSQRDDGIFSRGNFVFDANHNFYTCPQGKRLRTTDRIHEGRTLLYRASKHDCTGCALKPKCAPNAPQRKIPRDVNEEARDFARSLVGTESFARSQRERKKIEMLFAHLKA